jgi:hypothetical protein
MCPINKRVISFTDDTQVTNKRRRGITSILHCRIFLFGADARTSVAIISIFLHLIVLPERSQLICGARGSIPSAPLGRGGS